MKEIKIEKIVVTIGKKELALTLTEAKELRKALGELFEPQTHHHWHQKETILDGFRYPWQQPIWYSNLPGTYCSENKEPYPQITLSAIGAEWGK